MRRPYLDLMVVPKGIGRTPGYRPGGSPGFPFPVAGVSQARRAGLGQNAPLKHLGWAPHARRLSSSVRQRYRLHFGDLRTATLPRSKAQSSSRRSLAMLSPRRRREWCRRPYHRVRPNWAPAGQACRRGTSPFSSLRQSRLTPPEHRPRRRRSRDPGHPWALLIMVRARAGNGRG